MFRALLLSWLDIAVSLWEEPKNWVFWGVNIKVFGFSGTSLHFSLLWESWLNVSLHCGAISLIGRLVEHQNEAVSDTHLTHQKLVCSWKYQLVGCWLNTIACDSLVVLSLTRREWDQIRQLVYLEVEVHSCRSGSNLLLSSVFIGFFIRNLFTTVTA